MVSVSLGRTRRPRVQINRHQREQQGKKIREVVASLRKQRERMSSNSGSHQKRYVGQRGRQRHPQDAGGPLLRSMAMGMHFSKFKLVVRSIQPPEVTSEAALGCLSPAVAHDTMLRSAENLMLTAEVVIIGGGIVGSSIAYHLAAAGCKDVLVIERESVQGKGSTGKSMGGVRAQFSTPASIQMSLYSIPFYATFEERMGYPSGYRPQGYLFCATNAQHMTYLRTNQEKQVELGLKDVWLITAEEISSMFPQLRSDDVVGGSFCSSDGFVDPYSAMIGFMTWAAEHGAKLWKNTQVTGIQGDGQGVMAVETSSGNVATRKVVNCAGAWAADIAKMVSLDLPVEPLRRMLVPTEPFDQFPHSAPMIIDMSTGFHFRPEGLGF